MTPEDVAAWEGFAVALAGVCAVLVGLVFLAVSINIGRILRVRGLAGRAGESVILFLSALCQCAFVLIPHQPVVALGAELLGVGLVTLAILAAIVLPLARRLHHDFRYNLTSRQRSGLVAYLSFVVSIGAVRGLTTAIRTQRLPLHDITAGGRHIHHYLPGIALLTAVGGIGVRGSDKASVHCLLGATYGTGCALITDELPLLLDLRDVHWTPKGRWALDVALAIIASAGAYFSGIPLWHGLREEITGKWPMPRPEPSPDS